jgi:hypothetical protein
MTTPHRAIGTARQIAVEALRKNSGVTVYRPITAQQGPLY